MNRNVLKCFSNQRICSFLSQSQLQKTCIRLSSTSPHKYDVTIVGGGIVGLATARELIHRWPNLSYAVLEKEDELSIHQTGHNSGVIHAGIYYKPGSLKAKLCVEGLKLTYKYCDEHNVPYKKVGKLIVAVTKEELPRIDDLYQRALQNGCSVSMVNQDEIKQIEPHCEGLKAIHSPLTGIVDFGLIARTYGKEFSSLGGNVHTSFEVTDFKESTDTDFPIKIVGSRDNQVIESKHLVVCGGLFADRLAAKCGCDKEPKIVPFRGDYLVLNADKRHLVNGNIYPVPDPRFPFLGVHYTPRMDGNVWLGPNAVLAFRREGYKFFDFNLKDFSEAIAFRGLQKLVTKNLSAGVGELYRVANRRAQVKQLQRFIPQLTINDVSKGPSGVRAQPLDANGNLVDDFVFDSGTGSLGKRMLHVRSAPSPAATSSLAIAQMIAEEAKARFGL